MVNYGPYKRRTLCKLASLKVLIFLSKINMLRLKKVHPFLFYFCDYSIKC